ncbi:ABC transporter permease [Microbacterium sp. zg.Y909]|uniref:ABC transporter permease n=1 Tax=Microbacterium sp. zg.Y909 TaxID=2969413 RepID=UPI00214C2239|nr:proline/glycine betaine ABC transporter permease [Microbacterium sp. zg.Y909]MCR2826904.1 proline/glycine betaine ABC transporter permease [Microbacterium sp. zg.Y909]
MNDVRLPIGDIAETFARWLIDTFGWLFDGLRSLFLAVYDALEWVLQAPPFWAVIVVLAALALWAKGVWLAVGTVVGLLVIVGVGQWENAMQSLALVIVASVIALAIGIPLGIWAARSDTVSKIVRPVLDFLQTMPAFVYLIPALMLFRVGVVPGIVATILFALAPGVRLTELGIRGVDREVVEAGHAFGASPGRILRQIQLPLALPSIMAGVNQVIMLSLSMVVIAGMVGARGLGGDVVQSLQKIDIALGVEAGLSVVIIAMILDRVTSALAARGSRRGGRAASRGRGASRAARAASRGADADEPRPVAASA